MGGAARKRERKKQLRRQKIEEQIRIYRARRRRRGAVYLAVVATITGVGFAVVALGREEPPEPEKEACRATQPARPSIEPIGAPPPMEIDAAKTYLATVETSCGQFVMELSDDSSPQTVNSFVSLAKKKFFDGLTFHRIVSGFVVQGGDPAGDGTGGPGYQTVEPPPADQQYEEGIVAMAKSQTDPPGTAGSQFFVVVGERGDQLGGSPERPAQYALLGKVVEGNDTLREIESVETTTSPAGTEKSTPVKPVYIISIEIQEE